MLHQKISAETYKGILIKKLSNFCDKAPILLKFITSDKGVTIIHSNSNTRYEFPWDFETPVKTFIYDIKMKILVHYPRMLQQIESEVALTPQEVAAALESGLEPDQIPATKTQVEEILWTITRVLVYKDIFLIQQEGSEEQLRYKMNKSCIHFLKNYRAGRFTLESAAEYFFKNSQLLSTLNHDETDDPQTE